jgi:hypothetical protein
VNVEKMAGDAARVVTLDARVRPLGGVAVRQRLTARLQQVDGRWTVAAITLLPASRTSPAASSALPN